MKIRGMSRTQKKNEIISMCPRAKRICSAHLWMRGYDTLENIKLCGSRISLDRKLTEIQSSQKHHPYETEAVKKERQRKFINGKAIKCLKGNIIQNPAGSFWCKILCAKIQKWWHQIYANKESSLWHPAAIPSNPCDKCKQCFPEEERDYCS